MRSDFSRSLIWTATLVLACNRHDASTRPPPLSMPDPSTLLANTPGLDPEALATTGGANDAGALTPAMDASPESNMHAPDPSETTRTQAERIAHPCRVLVVGDSLSDTKSHGGAYLNAWRDKCPSCQITNLARGGAMANQMLRGLREHIATNPPRYTAVIVFGGVNDLYSDQTAKRTNDRIERDLAAIYRLARDHADRVVAITVAPWGGFRKWYTDARGRNTFLLNRWIVGRVNGGDVDAVVESGPVLSCGDPERLCPEYMPPFRDGLHFGSKGHQQLGTALVKALGSCNTP